MTHRESDKRMTKEREAEIRTPCIGYEPQEHVKELLTELDALKAERGEMAKLMWLRFTREGASQEEHNQLWAERDQLKQDLAKSKDRARILREALKEAYTALVGGSERGGVFWRENAFQDIYKVLNDDQVLQRPESSC